MTARRRAPRRQYLLARSKIARLPLAIREEIVRRLLDGHSQQRVRRWLNRLTIVRHTLRCERIGRAKTIITDNNLSSWAQRTLPPRQPGTL